jgi:hypothetical protein
MLCEGVSRRDSRAKQCIEPSFWNDREDEAVLDYIRSSRLPVHSYRQKGVGGPLRILHDPSEKITHDFFDRDELDVPRRGVDLLSGLLKRAEEAEVGSVSNRFVYHAADQPPFCGL